MYVAMIQAEAWRRKLEAAGFKVIHEPTSLLPENERATLPPPALPKT